MLYHAQIHPEQYSNTLHDEQIKELHSAIHHVCSTSVDLLGDASQFPADWLFPVRWNKGKKDAPQCLPNGDEVKFITVGGRTSAFVPAVQKTGAVSKESAGKVSDGEDGDDEKTDAKSTDRKRKATEKASEKPATKAKTTAKKPKAEPAAPLRRGRSAAAKK